MQHRETPERPITHSALLNVNPGFNIPAQLQQSFPLSVCLVVATDLVLWNPQQGVRGFCECYQKINHNITVKAHSHPSKKMLLRKSSQFSISITASLHFYRLTSLVKCYLANLYQNTSLQPRERNKRFHSHQRKLKVHFVLSNEKYSLVELLTTPRKCCQYIQI